MSELSDSTVPDWSAFRKQMPITERWVYLDHAAVAPLPRPSQEALTAWAAEAAEQGATRWPAWSRRVEQVRGQAAELFGARPEEIALVRNTTCGISLVAEGFPWRDGDNVVTLENEFPSNQYPWMHLASRGVELRRVPVGAGGRVDLDRIAEACDARTRIVSASWVGFADGWRSDVDALATVAHDHGALLFLDAIQGAGIFPIDVCKTPVDFLATDGHKWMLGPEGAGFLFLRQEHFERIRPWGVGWHSVAHAYDFDRIELDFKPTAARFEGGSENMAGYHALGASLEMLLALGVDQVGQRILAVTELACEQLAKAGATIVSCRESGSDSDPRSGIVSFTWPGDMTAMRRKLLAKGVVVSFRGGRLRISPHAYNDASDIDRLVEALRDSG